MNLKFLPIGTVCLVEGVSKKQMIIGYSKSGYDYVAVAYPKGFESDNKLSYFNHSQVYELYSLGYKNEESRIFNGTLVSVSSTTVEEVEESSFPEVKVETLEEPKDVSIIPILDEEKEEVLTPEEDSSSKEETVVERESFPSIRFDENGVVIADSTSESLDFNKDTVLEEKEVVPKEESFQPQIQFDENGVVVSDGVNLPEEISTVENTDFSSETPVVDELVTASSQYVPLSDDATIDVSAVVKQIEDTVADTSSDDSTEGSGAIESLKKEKRGLFHFGRK